MFRAIKRSTTSIRKIFSTRISYSLVPPISILLSSDEKEAVARLLVTDLKRIGEPFVHEGVARVGNCFVQTMFVELLGNEGFAI